MVKVSFPLYMQIRAAPNIWLFNWILRVALDVSTFILNTVHGYIFLQHDDRYEHVPLGRPSLNIQTTI